MGDLAVAAAEKQVPWTESVQGFSQLPGDGIRVPYDEVVDGPELIVAHQGSPFDVPGARPTLLEFTRRALETSEMADRLERLEEHVQTTGESRRRA